jgi:hypothetical protein
VNWSCCQCRREGTARLGGTGVMEALKREDSFESCFWRRTGGGYHCEEANERKERKVIFNF